MNASKPTRAAHFNYIGSIELPIEIVNMCPKSGPADNAITEMLKLPEVVAEMKGIDKDKLKLELQEYGVWPDKELSNHEDNITRILWIACGNIQEDMYNEQNNAID